MKKGISMEYFHVIAEFIRNLTNKNKNSHNNIYHIIFLQI